ncbi:hypothetical protein Rs2_52740 [Raphanus sativus]|uniref:Uncharacterized protein LOC130507781 n=1 Tax=Raphanus sativus TaxID=3726 RepID=A0A9W3D3J7_RAPSA|nr:uncharacterized protein LOC130507781 [Raphanus sativus]KAJ4865745.1 hypothetical protein Rs2_52740 [Raphanus sativus]
MSESVDFQSVQSEISSSSNYNVVRCNCNREANVVRAWTPKNPGRRFYGCSGFGARDKKKACNFFRWYDLEKPHGWQHLDLLEARDIIQEQKDEIADLRTKVSSLTHSSELEDKLKKKGEECEALKREVVMLREKSSVIRNVVVSSVGFGVFVGGIMVMSKW